MTNNHLSPAQLVVFQEEKITRSKAINYLAEMKKANTSLITVEKANNNKYNVIGGFKYMDAVRLLQENVDLYCTIVDSFNNEKERKLATLQCCLGNNEKVKYKEILVHELTKVQKMDESAISIALGLDAKKIERYMYHQIIPRTYTDQATRKGAKQLIQAIYLANGFTPFEKRVLTELSLYPIVKLRFKGKHIGLYKQYRIDHALSDDFATAKRQVLQAINLKIANAGWGHCSCPHSIQVKHS